MDRLLAIADKYNAVWKNIQAYASISASTTSTTTYSVPGNQTFIPVYMLSGIESIGNLKLTLNLDGTLIFDGITVTKALTRNNIEFMIFPVDSSVIISVQNTDSTASHTGDIIVSGFLIPRNKTDDLLNDLREGV